MIIYSHDSFQNKLIHDKNKKSKHKTITMVLINAFLNFLLRLPEITNLFILFDTVKIFQGSFYLLCFNREFCGILIDISNFFYIFTFLCNFFILLAFNNKLRANYILFSKKK